MIKGEDEVAAGGDGVREVHRACWWLKWYLTMLGCCMRRKMSISCSTWTTRGGMPLQGRCATGWAYRLQRLALVLVFELDPLHCDHLRRGGASAIAIAREGRVMELQIRRRKIGFLAVRLLLRAKYCPKSTLPAACDRLIALRWRTPSLQHLCEDMHLAQLLP